jgi:hypothetical protein
VNANAIANLFKIAKDIMVQSYDRIWNISRVIIWLKYTINGQSELYTAVRQLEFALLRMTQQISDLLGAVVSAARKVTYEFCKSGYITEHIEKRVFKPPPRI